MLKYWVWLTTREGLSRKGVLRVLEYFDSPQTAMFADREEYARISGLTDVERAALEDRDLASAERILDECYEKNIQLLTIRDGAYPDRLRQLEDAPALLYWKGRLPTFDTEAAIGVVGTRRATAYGLQTAKRMGYQIGACGGMVVSGMAKGVDALATEGCLSAGRPAVGVLGCGVDVVYPKENRSLFRDMEERGCLISEYPPGTEPMGGHFPVRNRIISGLCLGVLVVEAPARSGALITARLALEQGRDVFAIPGTIDTDAFEGSNGLIRQGAQLVTSGWDLLSEYEYRFSVKLKPTARGGTVTLTERQYQKSRDGGQTYKASAGRIADPAVNPVAEAASSLVKIEENTRSNAEKTAEISVSAGGDDKKGIDNPKNKPYSDLESIMTELSADERAIVYYLLEKEMQADDLITRTGLAASRVLAALTMLQVRGVAEQSAGKIFRLIPN